MLFAAAPVVAAGAVIKGGTLIITPGAAVEGNIAHIRTIKAPAGLEVDCAGGTTYAISTGTRGGTCSLQTDDFGAVTSARCEDEAGNSAAMSCSDDAGKGACGDATGSGSCRKR
jgi:hypothetical protein